MLCEYCGRYNNNREDCLSCGALLPRATPRSSYYGDITGVHDLGVAQEKFLDQYGTLPNMYFPVGGEHNRT